MIEAKVNGKQVSIETSYEELSFRKYLKLVEGGIKNPGLQISLSHILSIFLDMPQETIKKAKFMGLEPVERALSFIYKEVDIEEFPTKVGPFAIPKDIRNESVAQSETMAKYINEAAKMDNPVDQVKQMAMYCAIYCQPLRDGEFDEEKAQWLVEEIMDCSCVEVMSAGVFFTVKFTSSKRNLEMNYLYRKFLPKRRRRGLASFLRRSGFTRLSTISRAIWASLTRKR